MSYNDNRNSFSDEKAPGLTTACKELLDRGLTRLTLDGIEHQLVIHGGTLQARSSTHDRDRIVSLVWNAMQGAGRRVWVKGLGWSARAEWDV